MSIREDIERLVSQGDGASVVNLLRKLNMLPKIGFLDVGDSIYTTGHAFDHMGRIAAIDSSGMTLLLYPVWRIYNTKNMQEAFSSGATWGQIMEIAIDSATPWTPFEVRRDICDISILPWDVELHENLEKLEPQWLERFGNIIGRKVSKS